MLAATPYEYGKLKAINRGQTEPRAQPMSLTASEKNSGPPKLPDFKASSISPTLAPTARNTGTPAAISTPTRKPGIFRRSTTDPDVSPPATTSRRTPD